MIVAVVGPTATGKSALALDLAEHLDAEIVNADAMQFYRGMDIGTAKLAPQERRGIAHHQLDVLDVTEDASVADYQRDGRADLDAIAGRGRAVVVVGGSGLYLRALLDRLEFPGTDAAVRAALEQRAEHEGPGLLHDDLARRDPEAAARIPRQNARRIIRALEVIELTGRPYSASMPEHTYAYPAVQIGLDAAQPVLTERVTTRAATMFEGGLVEEARGLLDVGLDRGRTSGRAVGYAQALAVLDGELTVPEAVASTAVATRQLARRQRTWFRRDPRIHWLDVTEPRPGPELLEAALRLLP